MIVRERIAAALQDAVADARAAGDLAVDHVPAVQVDVPPSPELGDFSSNVALALARPAGLQPVDLAAALRARLQVREGLLARVDISATGVLNFYLHPDWLRRVVDEARRQGREFGKTAELGRGRRALVEFVSANPTGPLTTNHGRGAAFGDALSRLLEWTGYRVTREYYVNDADSSMQRFAAALEMLYLRAHGRGGAADDTTAAPYLQELTAAIVDRVGDRFLEAPAETRREELVRLGRELVLKGQQETLERFGARFDEWYSERSLLESGKLEEVLDVLRRRGHTYETDGALWLRNTAFGDTEDRPLLRSNGQPTYITTDLAYHLDKFRREFEPIIDVWGPEHAGYVGRTRAGIQALGCDPGALEIRILQPVLLRIDGMPVEGDALTGNIRLLDEVIEKAGPETARFFFLMRPAGAPLELDLDLARRTTPDNPLRRVQQAHARACEALRGRLIDGRPDPAALQAPAERALLRKLADFPDEVYSAGVEREPARLTRYAVELAAAFEQFPTDAAETADASARLAVVEATAVVLRNILAILGISAPERVQDGA